MSDKTALITGASAGIGTALATEFAARGHDLVLVARRQEALDALANRLRHEYGVRAMVHAADLTKRGAPRKLFDALAGEPIEILVNNAGVLTGGYFDDMPESAIDNMLRLNVIALTGMCRQFIGPMLERGSGRILNLASIAAFQPVPSLAVYAATKAYVLSLSESLTVEAGGRGVTVTAVCPGPTDTDMLSGAEDMASGIPDIAVLTPEKVAQDAYKACMAGDAIKVPGVAYALSMAGGRLLPKWLVRRAGALALRLR